MNKVDEYLALEREELDANRRARQLSDQAELIRCDEKLNQRIRAEVKRQIEHARACARRKKIQYSLDRILNVH